MISGSNQIDAFRLTDLNPIYGHEISYVKGPEFVRIVAAMLACEDLVLDCPVELEFVFPLTYPATGGMQVFTTSPEIFRGTNHFIEGSNQLLVSGFDSARYPVGVWFFTIRMSLKKAVDPWITPFELCRSLPMASRMLEGGNIQRVEMIAGTGRTRGRRSYMEDVDYIFDNIRVNERVSIASFGVLDGHGGAECAKFAVDDIPVKIATNLRSGMLQSESLFHAFLNTDAEFLRVGRSTAGSTACVLLWDRICGTGYFANTGDTRAVMSRSGKAVELTRDKKATDNEEIARVCLGGGFVVNGRVLGSLAVSRALGDGQLKQPGKRTVIPDPDITAFRPNATAVLQASGNISMEVDEFIIIATDGLWDVVSSQQAVNFVREQFDKFGLLPDGNGASNPSQASGDSVTTILSQIGDMLAQHAVKNLSSLDNVTVMIIKILISQPEVELPYGDRLEGWQWHASATAASTVSETASGRTKEALDRSASYDNSSILSQKNSANSDRNSKSERAGSNGNSNTTSNTHKGNSSGSNSFDPELDFLYNDPMFASSPEKTDSLKKQIASQQQPETRQQQQQKSVGSSSISAVATTASTKPLSNDCDTSFEAELDMDFLLDDRNF